MTEVNAAPRQTSKKHHYIPAFYLKQWAGVDGRLCEFVRRHGRVHPRMTHPDGTGYQSELYAVEGLPPDQCQIVEDVFFRNVDHLASDALQQLINWDGSKLPVTIKSGWSRFIMSLVHRNPEKVAWLKDTSKIEFNRRLAETMVDYDRLRGPSDPPTAEEYLANMEPNAASKFAARLLPRVIDLEMVGSHINGMLWYVVDFSNAPHKFLTSDRPVLVTNGLLRPEAHILMPIGPRRLFVATNNEETRARLASLDQKHLISDINSHLVLQAQKRVYSSDARQLRFVENRLGKGQPQFIGAPRLTEEVVSPG